MAKIIHLFKENTEDKAALLQHIDELREAAEKGEIKSLLVAAEGDGPNAETIITGWVNMDYETRARMIVHHNMDLTKTMIDGTYFLGDEE